ncbi:MAG: hypothetical protein AAFY57_09030 [Cyanobacteria bacterium J06642_2]
MDKHETLNINRGASWVLPRRWTASLAIALCTLVAFAVAGRTQEQSLEQAEVDRIAPETADVTLRPNQADPRAAAVGDILVPLDELSTGANSLVQLIFTSGQEGDLGSLIRLGQNSLFRFVPEGREFVLDNGTVMLVTPPGAGGGRLVTPAAVAAVQGSLLVATARENNGSDEARFLNFSSRVELRNPDTEATIGALSPGQAALAIDGELITIVDFDIESAVETASLLEKLEPNPSDSEAAQSAIVAEKALVEEILAARERDDGLLDAVEDSEQDVEDFLLDSEQVDDSIGDSDSFRDIEIEIQ